MGFPPSSPNQIRENTIFWTYVGTGNFPNAPIFGKSIKFALMFSHGIFDNWLHGRRGWLIFLKDGVISYANCFASFENYPLLWNIVHLVLLACTGVNCGSSTNSNLADSSLHGAKKHQEDLASSYHNPFTYIAVSPIFHHGKKFVKFLCPHRDPDHQNLKLCCKSNIPLLRKLNQNSYSIYPANEQIDISKNITSLVEVTVNRSRLGRRKHEVATAL